MADRKYGIETLCLHAGQIPDAATGSRAVPIYQTTSYVFDSADHAASLFNLQTFGNVYTRISNPDDRRIRGARRCTRRRTRAAWPWPPVRRPETTAVLTLLEQGDEIVSASTLYGGTYALFEVNLRKFGINTTFVNPDDPQNFKKALTKKTKLLYAETIGNPQINMLDIEPVAAIAKEAGIPLVIDNTFASPYLCRPFEVRRRHRRAFGDQVHRRPRHDDGRRDRRIGQVPVGQRQVSRHDRAVARLSRRALL